MRHRVSYRTERVNRITKYRFLVFLLVVHIDASAASAQSQQRNEYRRFFPLNALEPSRKVAAPNWTSLYCSQWDDGCTRCERKSISDKPNCSPISSHPDEVCKPRSITCSLGTQEPGWRHCASELAVTTLFDAQKKLLGYRVMICTPGRCEGPTDLYFEKAEDEKILRSIQKRSGHIWQPTDRQSLYCLGSLRELCSQPTMRGVAPCRSM